MEIRRVQLRHLHERVVEALADVHFRDSITTKRRFNATAGCCPRKTHGTGFPEAISLL